MSRAKFVQTGQVVLEEKAFKLRLIKIGIICIFCKKKKKKKKKLQLQISSILNYTLAYIHSLNFSSFYFNMQHFWPYEQIAIFSKYNCCQGLSDTTLKWDHPRISPGEIIRHNFERRHHKDDSGKLQFKLVLWFQKIYTGQTDGQTDG